MSDEVKPAHYFFDPMSSFPRRWRDKHGPVEVMTIPVKGYVMCRRPHAMPFVLRVSDLCNATKDPNHGPFEVLGVKTRKVPPAHSQAGDK